MSSPEIAFFSGAQGKKDREFRIAVSDALVHIFTEGEGGDDDRERSVLELVWLCVISVFDVKETTAALKYLLTEGFQSSEHQQARTDFVHILENAVWFWGTQIEYDVSEPPSEQWKKLAIFTSNLFSMEIIDDVSGKTCLPINLLIYSLNLAETEEDFTKKLIKIKTRLYFKQEKFNILREETEGYSKLITILSSLPAPPSDPSEHVKQVFSAVGQFDLDPNRVIDIILDSFEQQLWNLSFIPALHAFPSKNLLHILGFKFLAYHFIPESSQNSSCKTAGYHTISTTLSSAVSGKSISKSGSEGHIKPVGDDSTPSQPVVGSGFTRSTPESLYDLTALLIGFDLIKFDEIFPYLHHPITELAKLHHEETIATRSGLSAFNYTQYLRDKRSASIKRFDSKLHNITSEDTKDKSVIHRVVYSSEGLAYAKGEQLIGILASLLRYRLWKPAQSLIDKFVATGVNSMDWREISASMSELISWIIDPAYSSISPRTRSLGRPAENLNLIPIFASQPRQLLSISELFDSSSSDVLVLIRTIGHHLSVSPPLFSKLCRIFKVYVREKIPDLISVVTTVSSSNYRNSEGDSAISTMEAESAMDVDVKEKDEDCNSNLIRDIFNVVTETFLPALSRIESNPAISTELWGLISLFPFQIRFEMYDKWKSAGLAKSALGVKDNAVAQAEIICDAGAKYHMKRLAKDNIKVIGKLLAKFAHSGPLLVYSHILNQIEAFDNLIPFIVDALRFSTDLSRDCMAYCIVNQLRKESGKLKEGDTHYSSWFQALCEFIGTFYKKFPATELKGILHFLLQKLSVGDSLDLLVLKELLKKMGGCDTLLEISHDQLECLSGGTVLREEATGGVVKESVSKKAISNLRDELVNSGTALPLLLFISQVRMRTLYKNDSNQLKLVSYLFDTCQDVLNQFTDFLLSGSKALNSVVSVMPSMTFLINDVGLSLPIAFQLTRPLFRAAMQSSEDIEKVPVCLRPWHPLNPELTEVVRAQFPEHTWKHVTPEMYVSFWTLSLYDIWLPTSRYEGEIAKIRIKYNDVSIQLDNLNKSRIKEEKVIKSKKNEMTKLVNRIENLTKEMEEQKKHVNSMRQLIDSRKGIFFSKDANMDSLQVISETLMQICILPRVLMSPVDATFCGRFFFFLHSIDAPSFSTVCFVDKIVRTVTPLIFSTTEYEAGFIGFLLHNIFSTINPWSFSEEAYLSEQKHLGLHFNFDNSEAPSSAEYSQFLQIYLSWHKALKSIILHSLQNNEYMYIRSGLVLLTKVQGQYPARFLGGMAILKRVQEIEKKETDRKDLQLMAKMVGLQLSKDRSNWLNEDGSKPSPIKKSTPRVLSLPPKPTGGQKVLSGKSVVAASTKLLNPPSYSSSSSSSNYSGSGSGSGSSTTIKPETASRDSSESRFRDRDRERDRPVQMSRDSRDSRTLKESLSANNSNSNSETNISAIADRDGKKNHERDRVENRDSREGRSDRDRELRDRDRDRGRERDRDRDKRENTGSGGAGGGVAGTGSTSVSTIDRKSSSAPPVALQNQSSRGSVDSKPVAESGVKRHRDDGSSRGDNRDGRGGAGDRSKDIGGASKESGSRNDGSVSQTGNKREGGSSTSQGSSSQGLARDFRQDARFNREGGNRSQRPDSRDHHADWDRPSGGGGQGGGRVGSSSMYGGRNVGPIPDSDRSSQDNMGGGRNKRQRR